MNDDKRIRRARLPSVWVVGFPKSGNTWMNYLLSYCLNLPYHDFDESTNWKPREQWVCDLTSGGHPWCKADPYHAVQKTHRLPGGVPTRGGLVIYASRDPRDVFVSYMHFMKTRFPGWKGKLRFRLLGLLGRGSQMRWMAHRIRRHRKRWNGRLVVVLSYERLLAEGPAYLQAQLAAIDLPVDESVVRQAFEAFSFRNMSEGREAGQEDKSSFMRKGIAGDWRNHMTPEEGDLFKPAMFGD